MNRSGGQFLVSEPIDVEGFSKAIVYVEHDGEPYFYDSMQLRFLAAYSINGNVKDTSSVYSGNSKEIILQTRKSTVTTDIVGPKLQITAQMGSVFFLAPNSAVITARVYLMR